MAKAAAKPLITVVDEDPPVSPEPSQDDPGAAFPSPVDQRAARQDAARIVALWLRGKAFPLGHPGTNMAPAAELFRELNGRGFEIVYVGRRHGPQD